MTTERKYKKQINRDGWMVQVQQFVWGEKTPQFVGYCPFFWFTWLSLLAVPFKIVLLFLTFPFIALGKLIQSIPTHPSRPSDARLLMLEDYVRSLGMVEGPELWANSEAELNWIKATPDWYNCVLAVLAKKDRRAEKQAKRDSRDKKRLSKVANNLHYVVRPLVYIASGTIIFFAGKFLFWAWAFYLLAHSWSGNFLAWGGCYWCGCSCGRNLSDRGCLEILPPPLPEMPWQNRILAEGRINTVWSS